MIRVGVVGATGYAGAELVRLLSGHPEVDIAILSSRQYAGRRYEEVFPAFSGKIEQVLQAYNLDAFCESADVIFTALPHQVPMGIVPDLIRAGKSVIDLSADFRFSRAKDYEACYQKHTAPDLLDESVYGLSEIYRSEIASAKLIGNPGCYPTCVLLPLIPLLKAGLLRPGSLIADAKSGVSGAGRSPSVPSLFSEVAESFKAYKVAEHRHNPEMDQILGRILGENVHITFVPHLTPMVRGMEASIYGQLEEGADFNKIHACLVEAYQQEPFIRLCGPNRVPNTLYVRGTNFCDIGVREDQRNQRIIILSVIDNLVKGAAGQAVQNMNLMMGLDETTGLTHTAFSV